MTDEQRAERIHHHQYSGEGIVEHCERIVALEELVADILPFVEFSCGECCRWYGKCDIATCHAYEYARERAGELGIEAYA